MELFGDTKDFIRSRYFWLRERLSPSKYSDAKQIPIIINSFNRLSTLKLLIASLEERGWTNIHILDNCSTYPPLLEWFKTIPYEVIHLPGNLGFKALWKHKPSRKRFCGDYYIYTDADLVLGEKCPADIIERMFDLLKNKYPTSVFHGGFEPYECIPKKSFEEIMAVWEIAPAELVDKSKK
jgi:hypothetical protein